MNESHTNREIINSINVIGSSWAWKIPDVSPIHRSAAGGGGFRPDRAIIPRAYDIIACIHGLMFAIEGKIIKGLGGLSVQGITEFERRSLLAVERAGGLALLAIAVCAEATTAQMKKHNLDRPKVRELHLLTISDWMALESALPDGLKTVPRHSIVTCSRQVRWIGKGIWDIERPLYDLHPGSANCSNWVPGSRDPSWVPFVAGPQGRLAGYSRTKADCDSSDNSGKGCAF